MQSSLRILVVDDEPIACKRLKASLAQADYAVDTAPGGAEAVQMLENDCFDIVVTDICMDQVDGIAVLDAVSRLHPKSKTILITGYASVEVAREALAKGAYDFIAKPFQPKDLRAIIDKAAKEIRRTRPQARADDSRTG